jgi:hypothetical protein
MKKALNEIIFISIFLVLIVITYPMDPRIAVCAPLSILIHEIGHFVTAKYFNLHPKFKLSGIDPSVERDSGKNITQDLLCASSGFLCQITFALFSFAIGIGEFNTLLLILASILGSFHDFKNIWRRVTEDE